MTAYVVYADNKILEIFSDEKTAADYITFLIPAMYTDIDLIEYEIDDPVIMAAIDAAKKTFLETAADDDDEDDGEDGIYNFLL